jgi:serine protease inhibitor
MTMCTTIRYTSGLLLTVGLIAACGADDPDRDDAATDPSDGPASASEAEPAPDTTAAREATAAGVAFPASAGSERAEPTSDAPVEALAAGLNDAGFDLLGNLPVEDNVVFSPASIGHAVLIAEAAGDDVTAAAIDTAFGLPPEAHEAWNTVDGQIEGSSSEQVTVRIADRIWPRVGSEPDQDWIDLIASRHGVDVVPLDFADGPASQREINGWVGEQTEGLIPDLLAAPPTADIAPGSFPAISPDAFLGGAVHAADIAVDEYGTVAAAATELVILESGPPEPELTVAADRPFVHLIRHRDSGLVLFAGHVADPTA